MDIITEEVVPMTENLNRIVQMPVRIDAKTRNELKIVAIKKGMSLNDLLMEYIMDGFSKEKKE